MGLLEGSKMRKKRGGKRRNDTGVFEGQRVNKRREEKMWYRGGGWSQKRKGETEGRGEVVLGCWRIKKKEKERREEVVLRCCKVRKRGEERKREERSGMGVLEDHRRGEKRGGKRSGGNHRRGKN